MFIVQNGLPESIFFEIKMRRTPFIFLYHMFKNTITALAAEPTPTTQTNVLI